MWSVNLLRLSPAHALSRCAFTSLLVEVLVSLITDAVVEERDRELAPRNAARLDVFEPRAHRHHDRAVVVLPPLTALDVPAIAYPMLAVESDEGAQLVGCSATSSGCSPSRLGMIVRG